MAAVCCAVGCGLAVIVGSDLATMRPAHSAPATFTEHARSASRFVDSIGFNVHLSYRDTGYGNFARIETLLRGIGVRHLRDGVTLGQTDTCSEARRLAADDVRFTYITQANPTADLLTKWSACVGPAVEAFEGLNEYDISHPAADTNWVGTVRSSQQALFRSVKQTPQLTALAVVGPSLTSEAAFRSVGDLSSAMDDGNMHNYFSNHEPETGGWGDGGYGSIAYNVRVAQAVDAAKPIESTETGYGTDRADQSVDDVAQATYLPRLLLEQFAAGIPRTFPYEFVDEGPPPYAHYGIVNGDLSPKPAYTALASLIAALRAGPSSPSGGTLSYALDGGGDALHHLLLQTGNGHFVLALWLADASYDPLTRETREVAQQTVTMTVARGLRGAAAQTYGPDWQLHRTALPVGGPLRVPVGDRVTLVDLAPAP